MISLHTLLRMKGFGNKEIALGILCRGWISTWHSLDSRGHELDSQFQRLPKKSLRNPFDEEERGITKHPPKTQPTNGLSYKTVKLEMS